MITAVPGFKVGHYTDLVGHTGCTVLICPKKTRASCDVRGSSPGTREIALLSPDKSMQEVHAILLTGGSAFGLSAADGVVRWLEEQDVGYQTPWAKVPIVPAAVVFDLNLGDSQVRPDPLSGYSACEDATEGMIDEGNVGAGTGATVGKWRGIEYWMKGGVGSASKKIGELVVGALVVVNAVGDIVDEHGNILAGARAPDGRFFGELDPYRMFARGKVLERTNTTLAIAATNADLSKTDLYRIAQRMHDGMARAIVPVHTSFDGDISFALSHGSVSADLDLVAELAAQVVAVAIRSAVRKAKTIRSATGLASL